LKRYPGGGAAFLGFSDMTTTTTNVSIAAAALFALATIPFPARAEDPHVTFTTTEHGAALQAAVFHAARKVCAESAKLPDAGDFGPAAECIHVSMSAARVLPTNSATLTAPEKHG